MKPDFTDAKRQWSAFWEGKNNRPLFSAVVPKPGVTPVKLPPYASGHDGDFEPVIDQVLAYGETHDFLGEAIPFFNVEFAANHFSALLGADLVFPEGGAPGGWAEPFVKDLKGTVIRFDPQNRWWKRTEAFLKALCRRSDGRLMVCAPSLVANLDALAALHGTEELMLDIVESPGEVHRALRQVTVAQNQVMDKLNDLLDVRNLGSINRHGMAHPGATHVLQSDASCMISSAMFREFVLPYLIQESQPLDDVDYHLDGPGSIQHLEAVCGIEKVKAIQWVPGAGEPSTKDWGWLYEKILSTGKGVVIDYPVNSEEMLGVCDRLRTHKIYFRFYQAASKEEVEQVQSRLESLPWCKKERKS